MGAADQGTAASAIATSTCCATPWRWTRSIRAASISAPPAARSTPRPTPATTGRRSCAIFRRCFRSRSRRCHDSRRASGASAKAGARRRRGGSGGGWAGDAALGARCARSASIRCCAEPSAITSRSSAGRSSGSSPASEDISHESPDLPLPEAVLAGAEPLMLVGAIAGG